MKADLDRLMEEASLDALFILGAASHNPSMGYFAGKAHITNGEIILRRGEPGVLFHGSMEREEAASTGLRTKNIDEYNLHDLIKQANGDPVVATAMRYQRMFEDLGVSGRIGVYGKVEVGPSWSVFRQLESYLPEIELVGEASAKSVLTRARSTKDQDEVDRIRRMGQATVEVVAKVAELLTTRPTEGDVLLSESGEPLMVGEVKRRINLWLAERGADNPEGTILSLGRDAGVPHSAGKADDPLRLGVPIIFDLYPTEAGGGFFHDFTRTWCLGYAPDVVVSVYEDVLAVYKTVSAALEAGRPCREFQIMACQEFEKRGHPTVMSRPGTQEGYVHSLSHGVGLAIHELPSFSHFESNKDLLLPGSVITFEPGLYYPERGLGVRLEDTLWVRPDGEVETLAPYPMDLVLPMKA